jgi:3-oxoacyl-[acyl-carrier-protein] synthase II
MANRVAVTGMGVVSPLGLGLEATLAPLRIGRTGIGPITLFDPSPYPSGIAGEVPWSGNVEGLGRGSSLLLFALDEALALARLSPPLACDLVLGTTLGGMERGTAYMRSQHRSRREDLRLLDDFLPACQLKGIRQHRGLKGTAEIISNACSSGTDAIGLAAARIRSGRTSVALAGGYDPFCEFVFSGFGSLLITAKKACRPFDRDREGMVIGEGAAILVLEDEKMARARGAPLLGFVRGQGAAADAFHLTQPSPEGRGLSDAVRAALESGSVDPADIAYINLHGTGTRFNDAAEYQGMASVLGDVLPSIPASSTKGMTGHALGGAGAIEAVFCLLALNHGFLPPNTGLQNRDAAFEGLSLIEKPQRPCRGRFALSNSLGFGGECGCLLLQKGEVA